MTHFNHLPEQKIPHNKAFLTEVLFSVLEL